MLLDGVEITRFYLIGGVKEGAYNLTLIPPNTPSQLDASLLYLSP